MGRIEKGADEAPFFVADKPTNWSSFSWKLACECKRISNAATIICKVVMARSVFGRTG